MVVDSKDRPGTLAKAIKKYDEERLSNFFVLKITCTFSITFVECDRSFSAMRTLRTWPRVNMKMERLGSVAVMDIHQREEVDYKHPSKLFFQLHPRNINLTYLLFERIFWNLKKWIFWFKVIFEINLFNSNFIKPCKLFFDFICLCLF